MGGGGVYYYIIITPGFILAGRSMYITNIASSIWNMGAPSRERGGEGRGEREIIIMQMIIVKLYHKEGA